MARHKVIAVTQGKQAAWYAPTSRPDPEGPFDPAFVVQRFIQDTPIKDTYTSISWSSYTLVIASLAFWYRRIFQ